MFDKLLIQSHPACVCDRSSPTTQRRRRPTTWTMCVRAICVCVPATFFKRPLAALFRELQCVQTTLTHTHTQRRRQRAHIISVERLLRGTAATSKRRQCWLAITHQRHHKNHVARIFFVCTALAVLYYICCVFIHHYARVPLAFGFYPSPRR